MNIRRVVLLSIYQTFHATQYLQAAARSGQESRLSDQLGAEQSSICCFTGALYEIALKIQNDLDCNLFLLHTTL